MALRRFLDANDSRLKSADVAGGRQWHRRRRFPREQRGAVARAAIRCIFSGVVLLVVCVASALDQRPQTVDLFVVDSTFSILLVFLLVVVICRVIFVTDFAASHERFCSVPRAVGVPPRCGEPRGALSAPAAGGPQRASAASPDTIGALLHTRNVLSQYS